MLTPEEERERAIEISKLYNHAPEKSRAARAETLNLFKWSEVIKPAALLVLSGIAVNILITVFTNVGYGFKEDVAAAGMLFILASLAGWFFVYKAGRYFYNKLYDATKNFSLMFWSSLFFLVPVFFLLRNLTIDASDHNFLSILLQLGLHGLLFIAVSISFIALLAFILEKTKTTEIVRIKLVLLLTSVPYLMGFIFSLIL